MKNYGMQIVRHNIHDYLFHYVLLDILILIIILYNIDE